MSKDKKAFKRWDQYVTEASHPDFEIPVDDRVIRVKAPTGGQVLDMQAAMETGSTEDQLRIICGDAADDVLPLVKAAPAGVMGALVTDIAEHFGFATGESPASSR